MREKHLLGGHFLTPNCVFLAIVREIILIRLACAGAQKTKAVKQESRKEGRQEGRIHKKCMFHVCVTQLLAGELQPNLENVFVSRT